MQYEIGFAQKSQNKSAKHLLHSMLPLLLGQHLAQVRAPSHYFETVLVSPNKIINPWLWIFFSNIPIWLSTVLQFLELRAEIRLGVHLEGITVPSGG